MNASGGIGLIVLAGLLQGTFMLPMKYTHRWSWENTWLCFSCTAYLIFPWALAILTVPHLAAILHETSATSILQTSLFGLGWGLGALAFGLGVELLGLALGFAIILGLTASIGTLIPFLILSPARIHSIQGLLILTGVVLMLGGICICSWAGKLKDDAVRGETKSTAPVSRKAFALGLFFCIASGVLSPCGNLGFTFGAGMSDLALKWGTPVSGASNPFWALITVPVFICNAVLCVYLLIRNGSFRKFWPIGNVRNYSLGTSMGAMWLIGMALYGIGAREIGHLGPSIGWSIMMSLVVIVANLWGIFTGEWKGTGKKPARIMALGLMILVVAIFVIGAGNRA
ncbi:MAG: L-rhamnose/proton symporter RhaT [Candidatus Acidiferrales bacterium]